MKVMYTYVRHEEEKSLCELELRSLFGNRGRIYEGIVEADTEDGALLPDIDRSPFFKRRLNVQAVAKSLPELVNWLTEHIHLDEATFKVISLEGDEKFSYEEQRQHERQVGAAIRGKADMRSPVHRFGLMRFKEQWLFGSCEENQPIWLKHQSKPQNYSTALPVRAARAIVNIAVGTAAPATVELIDPCCGMGTVLIEAMSMGIAIKGMDMNPLAVRGARLNLSHFGYADVVRLGDLRQENRKFDAAIVDMPYNLCSVLTEQDSLQMLHAIRRMADRAIIVTTEEIPSQLEKASFRMKDYASLSKGSFTRYISVVE